MSQINPSLPIVGPSDSTEEPKIVTALSQILSVLNGNIDDTNIAGAGLSEAALADALMAKLGITKGSNVRRGKSIVATSESRSNVAYGLLATPDRVQNLVLPTDGLIAVSYQALWQESVAGAGRAALFLGSNQVQVQADMAGPRGPVTQAAVTGGFAAAVDLPLCTFPLGLICPGAGNAFSADVTTGQVLGFYGADVNRPAKIEVNGTPSVVGFTGGTVPTSGFGGTCLIKAAASTYDVSVQFKSSSGSVTAKNRELRVWTIGF